MARLYFKGTTAAELGATFAREGDLVGKRCLRHMRQVANLVMQQSIRNSPVDWKGYTTKSPPGHELERSHHIEEQYSNNRIECTVLVGGIVDGVDVDRYAVWLHESFDWKLGKASLEKEGADPRNQVGPLFLERALTEYDNEFEDWGGSILDEIAGALMQ